MSKLEIEGVKISSHPHGPGLIVPIPDDGPWDPMRAWIEPGDFRVISVDPEEGLATIEIEWTEEEDRLLKNFDLLCYDGDPEIRPTRWEDGGHPELEIAWAVLYRGGLDVGPEEYEDTGE